MSACGAALVIHERSPQHLQLACGGITLFFRLFCRPFPPLRSRLEAKIPRLVLSMCAVNLYSWMGGGGEGGVGGDTTSRS